MRDVYSALAHPVRREILSLVRDRRMSAGEIAEHFDISKPTLSGHFSVLRKAGLLISVREGTTIWYRMNPRALQDVITTLMKMIGLGTDAPEERPCNSVRL